MSGRRPQAEPGEPPAAAADAMDVDCPSVLDASLDAAEVAQFYQEAMEHDARLKADASRRIPSVVDWSQVFSPRSAALPVLGLGSPLRRRSGVKRWHPLTTASAVACAARPRVPPRPPPVARQLTTNPVVNFRGDGKVTAQRRAAAGDSDGGYFSDGGAALPPPGKPSRQTTKSERFDVQREADRAAYINAQPGCDARRAGELEALRQVYEAQVEQKLADHACCKFRVTADPLKVTWKPVLVVTLSGSFVMPWPVSMECSAAGCCFNGACDGSSALNPYALGLCVCNPTWLATGAVCNTLFSTQMLDMCQHLVTGVAELSFQSAPS